MSKPEQDPQDQSRLWYGWVSTLVIIILQGWGWVSIECMTKVFWIDKPQRFATHREKCLLFCCSG